jgi:hypothetical protein
LSTATRSCRAGGRTPLRAEHRSKATVRSPTGRPGDRSTSSTARNRSTRPPAICAGTSRIFRQNGEADVQIEEASTDGVEVALAGFVDYLREQRCVSPLTVDADGSDARRFLERGVTVVCGS